MPPKRELDLQGFAPQGSRFQSAGFFSGLPDIPLLVGQPPFGHFFLFPPLPPLPPLPVSFSPHPDYLMQMQSDMIPPEAFAAAGPVALQPVPPSAFQPVRASAAATGGTQAPKREPEIKEPTRDAKRMRQARVKKREALEQLAKACGLEKSWEPGDTEISLIRMATQVICDCRKELRAIKEPEAPAARQASPRP